MNYQLIEYAVRLYIDKRGILSKKNYNILIESSGYVDGNFFAFVVTDEKSDTRLYEVLHMDTNPGQMIEVLSYTLDKPEAPFFI